MYDCMQTKTSVYSYIKITDLHPPFVQVPGSWYSVWEGPDDPIVYLRSLVAKALALGSWEEKGAAGTLLKSESLDLSELFHPDTFLNALRQQTARCVCNILMCINIPAIQGSFWCCMYSHCT